MVGIIVYVHKHVKVKLRQDLMCSNLNSVWLEAGLARNKKILVNNLYREWHHLGDDSALSIPEQLNDWLEHLQYWEKALNSGFEVVSLGDYNLNHCNWTDTSIPRSNQTYKLRSLIDALFTRIFPHGTVQLVVGPTRHFPGQVSTGLDHFYTNIPEKISSVQKYYWGGSDHMLIKAIRKSKSIQSCQQNVKKHSYR